jgi:hypothetical protein
MRVLRLILPVPVLMLAVLASAAERRASTGPSDIGGDLTLFTKFTSSAGRAGCMLQLVAREVSSVRVGGELPRFSVKLIRTYLDKPASSTVLLETDASGVTGGCYVADVVVDEPTSTVYFVHSGGPGFTVLTTPLDAATARPVRIAGWDPHWAQFPITSLTIYRNGDALHVDATVRVPPGNQRLQFIYSLAKKGVDADGQGEHQGSGVVPPSE